MRAEPAYTADMPGTLMTAEELFRSSFPDKRVELVRGQLVVREPPGFAHGAVTARLASALLVHVAAKHLGEVLAGDAGFTLFRNPDTVRGPDVAFIEKSRVPTPIPAAFAEFPPDLAVEVLSPRDRPGEVRAKVADWLSAGTRLVWVLDLARREARVYRQDGTVASVTADGVLDGEDVIPGFTCRLGSVL
ncbi:MAG TPA: Uma2 family endonuclease [Gemmatimonadales bacterium]|nr:Uma2 family endonuclease [Gemmatimonadales bacterium]